MEKTQRDNATEYQLASAIARYVELRDVRLTDVNANFLVAKDEMLRQPELDVELGRNMSCSIAQDTRVISVKAKLKAEIHGPGDGEKPGPVLISKPTLTCGNCRAPVDVPGDREPNDYEFCERQSVLWAERAQKAKR